MLRSCLTAAAVAVLCAPAEAQETAFPATLEAHAIQPAATFTTPPADAPAALAVSGKFTGPGNRRTEVIGSVPGRDGIRETGLSLPFEGQPIQGFSGIKAMPDGTFWSLSDNGFGSQINSPDAMLMIHHLAFDWENGTVEVLETRFLSDPERVAPFSITMEGTETRYLTGADFDVESIQPVADGFWIGDEFGPYLLKFDNDGHLQRVVDTEVDGAPVLSPDNPSLVLPANPAAAMPSFNLKRSGGYEGLAIAPDGSTLYALLEGPLYLPDGRVEEVDGRPALRIIEFDLGSESWTGRSWLYPLAEGGAAIGDFNMIDATTALVIERDNGAGVPSAACPDANAPSSDCFASPARLKRIYKIELGDALAGGAVRKIGYIDLMAIADPEELRLQGGGEGLYDMPFVTIENVDVVDATHIVVGNDNNLPFSAGRALDRADDNEFVLLEVAAFLAAN
jgi:hypothetical protein